MPGRMLPKGRVKYSMHNAVLNNATSTKKRKRVEETFPNWINRSWKAMPFAQAEYGGQKNGWGHEPQAESP